MREWFGYDRIEDKALVDLINEVYQNYFNPLQNYFLPTMKILSKHHIGGRIVKKYDQPKTPLQRLLEPSENSSERIKSFKSHYQTL